MHYIEVETQGESKRVIVNCDHVSYLAESIYGATIHFDSGESIVCVGELRDIAERLFGDELAELAMLKTSSSTDAQFRVG